MNLFENYVDNGLNFARKKCVQAMQQVRETLVYEIIIQQLQLGSPLKQLSFFSFDEHRTIAQNFNRYSNCTITICFKNDFR